MRSMVFVMPEGPASAAVDFDCRMPLCKVCGEERVVTTALAEREGSGISLQKAAPEPTSVYPMSLNGNQQNELLR